MNPVISSSRIIKNNVKKITIPFFPIRYLLFLLGKKKTNFSNQNVNKPFIVENDFFDSLHGILNAIIIIKKVK